MSVVYKDAVLTHIPQLQFLDNVKILSRDRILRKFKESHLNQAFLIFKCIRIMGLPEPPKMKDVVQTFHVEVNLPLLEDYSDDQNKNDTILGSLSRSVKKFKSRYDAPDENKIEQQLNIKNTSFKTSRMKWDKIIQNSDDKLEIQSPENNLFALRDTFRSTVNVKVVYLKVLSKTDVTLKKVTLADFQCQLDTVNWSDATKDYYWAEHRDFGPNAVPVKGSLEAITYAEGKSAKGEPLPDVFTCQIGFGLKRLYNN
ncbi:hypothetical protein FQA39_LY02723 [Lamprigera yunnana]|nr:hypothetical protein FQA39_LY02723 [Lamprigera yunnana]